MSTPVTNPVADNMTPLPTWTMARVLAGCMYEAATSYNPAATYDDMSCAFSCATQAAPTRLLQTTTRQRRKTAVHACTQLHQCDATNYNPNAFGDDGACRRLHE